MAATRGTAANGDSLPALKVINNGSKSSKN